MRVLVVDDEAALADGIAECLRGEAYAVDVAYDGHAALERIGTGFYDLVVLERELPRVHGDEVHRTLVVSGGRSRVLMLTAGAVTPAPGAVVGADDYLAKPFAPKELIARVRALLRRDTRAAPAPCRSGVHLDPAGRHAVRHGREIPLSHKEFAVLAELLRAEGRIVTTTRLLRDVWPEHPTPDSRVLRVTMVRLRRKLGAPPLIRTASGTGYRIP